MFISVYNMVLLEVCVFRNFRIDSGLAVRSLFVSLPFGETKTQRLDIGQIAP
jgi:hypothetical protein